MKSKMKKIEYITFHKKITEKRPPSANPTKCIGETPTQIYWSDGSVEDIAVLKARAKVQEERLSKKSKGVLNENC